MVLQKRIVQVLFFLALIPSLYLFPAEDNCFSILIGKNASNSGSIMIAHNEDDRGKNFFVNLHKIPETIHKSDTLITLKNSGIYQQTQKTFGFLWLQIPDAEFADSYMNENGVVIASNSCPSREDKPLLTEGGIGFMLRRIMSERAKSARNAVEIASKLIETYGYYSSGRTYVIADSNEGWVLHIVKGKHWVAQRIPDNHAAVIANRYTIQKIDLSDKENFLGSPDIIDYAIKRGWYNPKKDGQFNFSKVYSNPKNFSAEYNILRQWRGTCLLARKKYKLEKSLPFSFLPKKDIKITELFKILRDHYEGTEYDETNDYKDGSPNKTKKRTICTESTQYSFVAKLRNNMPKEIANQIWIAFRRPDSNAYTPWYVSIITPPIGYTLGDSTTSLENHFQLPSSLFEYNSNYAFWSYAKLSNLVDQSYKVRIKMAVKKWRNFENFIMKMMKKTEKEFEYLVNKEKHIAQHIITNFVHKMEYRKWFMASELIEEIEK